MNPLRLRGAVGAIVAVIALAVVVGSHLSQADPAYSNQATVQVVVNTSGRSLPVLDGVTGAPLAIGDLPWVILPGDSFASYPWQGADRYSYDGYYYYYVGQAFETRNQFYLVEDWILNGEFITDDPAESGPVASVSLLPPPPTPTPVPTVPALATPRPVFGNYVPSAVSYEPNCGLTAVKGRIVNPDGGPRSGVTVRLTSGDYSAISKPSDDNGLYDITLASEAKAGVWTVQVWIESAGQSEAVTVVTDTHDCRPGGSGH